MEQTDHLDLCWRVEQSCLDAWPAARTIEVDGWLVRSSGGPTRRTNSINPQRHAPRDPASAIPTLAELYANSGQPLIFRVPSIAGGTDAALDALGFGPPEAETVTLFADIAGTGPSQHVELNSSPGPEWLAARARLNREDAAASAVFRAMTTALATPVRFAAARDGGGIAAIAYGAIRQRLLVIEAVATDVVCRRRGHARRMVGALMEWAREHGAEAACLQVVADNDAAIALYRSLGFERELYRYHYRRRPEP